MSLPDFPYMLEPKLVGVHADETPDRQYLRYPSKEYTWIGILWTYNYPHNIEAEHLLAWSEGTYGLCK